MDTPKCGPGCSVPIFLRIGKTPISAICKLGRGYFLVFVKRKKKPRHKESIRRFLMGQKDDLADGRESAMTATPNEDDYLDEKRSDCRASSPSLQ